MPRSLIKRLLRVAASALIVVLVTAIAHGSHAKSFVAGFIYLFPITLIAFRWGFIEASVASVLSVGCLDFFFTEPLFHFYMSDPQDWLALTSFEAIVLVVSQLADRLKSHAAEVSRKRDQVEKLYFMSRDILLLNRRPPIGADLVNLIREAFNLDGVTLWDDRETRLNTAGIDNVSEGEMRAVLFHKQHQSDSVNGSFRRVLFL